MRRLFSALKRYMILLLAASVIGCGSGGLSDAPPSSSPSPTPTPPSAATTVAGAVVDGFVAGATVRAHKLNADGTRGDSIGAATTTAANGNYSLNLGDYTGPILIESTGGTYKDWVTGNIVAVTSPLSAVLSNATGSVTVNVTPLTHMASLRARQDIKVNKITDVAAAIEAANTKIGEYFGILDIVKNVPIDPTVANSAVGVSQTRVDYALVMAGISQRASTGGMEPFALVNALAKDAEDGVFDGKQNGTQLTVAKTDGSTANLSAADAKTALSANIDTFQQSTTNISGGDATSTILTSLSDPANPGIIFAKPDIPSGFTVTAVSPTQINLYWSAVVGATGYKIYKGDVYLKSVTDTTAADTGLTPDTDYLYSVSAYDGSGNESARTIQLSATTQITAPPVPVGLMVTAISQSQINLTWTASAAATGYKIYKGNVYIKAVTTTAASDTGLTPDTSYCYAVTAYDASGNESARTTQLCATTNIAAPPVPTGLTVTAVSDSRISLTWTGAVGATGYRVYKAGEKLTDVTTTSAADNGLMASTLYCYSVSSFDALNNESVAGSQVCAATLNPPPADPANLTTFIESSSKVILNWSASVGAAEYYIYRNGVKIAASSGTTYTDTGATANAQNIYKVASVDASGSESSGALNQVTINTALTVPTMSSATANTASRITIVWANSGGTGVAGYKIYRNGTSVQTIPTAGTLTYADGTGLSASTQYCYRVSATDAAGKESAQSSASLCATTYAIPPADPAGLIVRPVSPTQVDLAWTASAGAAQYKIYRNGALLATTVSTSYTDAVAADTQYVYLVTAIDSTGSESSGATSNAAVNTGLTVPSAVTATVNSSTQITLSWTNSGGSAVTGYKVYKGDTLLGAVAPATTTSIVEGGLTPNTQYCYSVSSTDSFTNESAKSITVCGTTDAPPAPNSVDLLVSSPQLNSDGASPVTLTALVKDSQNRALSGQTVDFSATSGMLTDLKSVTDANGMATAKLGAGGDPTYRTIALTALTGGKTATNAVAVTGTNISIDPPAFSLPFNDAAGKQLTISLKDSAGGAIAGKTVSVASSTGKSTFIPASTYVTDNSGQIKVTVKNATDTTSDTITASAIGVSSQATLTINNAKLTVKTDTPKTDAEVPIKTAQPFTVTYTENGTAVNGKTVYFTATRGTLTASSSVTNASGEATVNVSSVNSGPSVLTAYTTGDPQASAQVAIIFVATTANKMDLSAFPAIIDTNAVGQTGEQSLIKAIVRDADDNLVKGKTVNFTITQDASAGTLSKGSAVTDMYGTATTNYIAGGNTGGLNNVKITATVQDTTPAVSKETTLTVGGQALFISLATGPVITKLEPNMYRKDYLALVTDAGGRPLANVPVTATVTPQYYMKGYYYVYGDGWLQMRTLSANLSTNPVIPACANEDVLGQGATAYYNGVLDAGEDQNANSRLDPGNVASVTASVTDSSGHSTISLTYAQDYAFWVNVKLEARASLGGSTTSAVQTFDLPGAAADYADTKVTPPGNPSPFGSNSTCYASLTALALSDTKISLHWEPSAYAASYNIWRDPNDGSAAAKIAALVPTSYEDSVAAGKTYCYEIKQVNSAGLETPLAAAGNRVCASSAATSPAGVTAVAISPTQIQVAWGDAGAAGYRIYKDGVYLQDSVARTIVSGNLTANTQYCYAVSSLNEVGGESAQSATVCATTQLGAPLTPTGLAAAGAAGPSVNLSWNASVGAALYRIYRDGALRLSSTGTAAIDDGAEVFAKTGYCYTISAVDASGNESAQSTPDCTATP